MSQSAPASILELADLATPMAIRVAATLNLAGRAGPDGKTAEVLAGEAGGMVGPLRRLLDITRAGGRTELAFVDLLEAVTTGRPAYQIRYGLEFWSDLDANPKLRSTFDSQMNWRFGDGARQIAMNYNWPGGAGTKKTIDTTSHRRAPCL
ncbi:hypothetical protein ABIB25_004256 [Nakamurella sp. UYEF19]|uniref:hypothetical protein n=1 Tax=Nakamurella sp. UYEF19 TaxID=1756392 RepID=UPI0033977623